MLDRKKLEKLYWSGMDLTELADKFEMSRMTLNQYIDHFNRKKLIRFNRVSNPNYGSITMALKVHTTTIHRYLWELEDYERIIKDAR